MLQDATKKLGSLYAKTGMDWDLHISHCLTEPTCPTVAIYPEGMETTRYTVWCDRDGIEKALGEVVDRVYREVIQGEVIEPTAPFTNPDDVKLEQLLAEWRTNAT